MPSDKKLFERINEVMKTERSEREANRPIHRNEYSREKHKFKKTGVSITEFQRIMGEINGREHGWQVKIYLGKARGLMDRGVEEGYVLDALEGARIYAKLNPDGEVPYSVKLRLTKALENENRRYDLSGDYIKSDARKVEKFIKGHKTKKGLEKHVATVAILANVGLIVGLVMLSTNITGYAIAPNINDGAYNSIGAGALLIGLIGSFLFFKWR